MSDRKYLWGWAAALVVGVVASAFVVLGVLQSPEALVVKDVVASEQIFWMNHHPFPASAVVDGAVNQKNSDWLLPPGQLGWVRLQLVDPANVRSIELENPGDAHGRHCGTAEAMIRLIPARDSSPPIDVGPITLPLFPASTHYSIGNATPELRAVEVHVAKLSTECGGFGEIRLTGVRVYEGSKTRAWLLAWLWGALLGCVIIERVWHTLNKRFAVAAIRSPWDAAAPLLGFVVGASIFEWIFGVLIVDPSYIEWLLRGDTYTSYIAWTYFRSEPWGFPLGFISGYGAPAGGYMSFADTAWLPILLKPFDRWLPAHFQYTGALLFLSCSLQGLFAAVIVRRLTKNAFIGIVSAALLILVPALLWRFDQHPQLAHHWMLLAAIALCLSAQNRRVHLVAWIGLFAVSVGTMPYFTPMLAALLSAYVARFFFMREPRSYRSAAAYLGAATATVGGVGYVLGLYSIRGGSAGTGWGLYSMNLNSPFNAMGWSSLLAKLPLYGLQAYEGFNYLGVGLMLLILVGVVSLLVLPPARALCIEHLPLAACVVCLAIFSLSNDITLGTRLVLHVPIGSLDKVLAVFRSSARFFWPMTYALVIFAIAATTARMRAGVAAAVLGVALTVQIADIRPALTSFQEHYLQRQTWQSPLRSPRWGEVMGRYRHLLFVSLDNFPHYPYFSLLAVEHGATVNVGYYGRYPPERATADLALLEDVRHGVIRRDALYVLPTAELVEAVRAVKTADDLLEKIDGYDVFAPDYFKASSPTRTPALPTEAK